MNQNEKANENEARRNDNTWKIKQLLNVVAFSRAKDFNAENPCLSLIHNDE
jgi:hypothetical protein